MADVVVEKHDSVTVITLNRPEAMNSLSASVFAGLSEAIRDFNADDDQLVAILTGAGTKAFCAGGDLKEMAANLKGARRVPVSTAPDISGVAAADKPTIAAINGLAVSGGLELALCCDIRIASTNAWFGLFEVKRGILAGLAVNTLPRLMPFGAVADMVLSGDRMTVDDAYRLGLVQQVVEPEDLLDAALAKARSIASNSPTAVWGSKQVLKYWRDLQIAESQRYYEAVAHRVMLSGDVLEGPRAFAEKREPTFSRTWPSPYPDQADGSE